MNKNKKEEKLKPKKENNDNNCIELHLDFSAEKGDSDEEKINIGITKRF